MNRALPSSETTEKAVLALALEHPNITATIIQGLKPADFYNEENNLIFRAITKLLGEILLSFTPEMTTFTQA